MRSNRTLGTMAIVATTAFLVIPATALAGSTPSSTRTGTGTVAAAATSDLQVALKAGPSFAKAFGSAQYQAQPGQREFQVEAQRLLSLAGHSVLVQVNGANVGWAKVSSTGIAQLTRNTELGQRVPLVTHGTTVTIKRSATGAVIASATF